MMKNHFIVAALATMTLGAASPVFAADMGNMNNMGNMSKSDSTEKVAHAVGVVKEIDAKQNTITFAHQPIKELNWPAMTMGFKVADEKLLKSVKVGDQVSFDLKGSGTAPMVTAIRPVK